MITWALRVKEIRKKGGLTFAEIGERTGLSPSAVSDIGSGRTASPRGEAAIALDSLYREFCSTPSTVIKRKCG